MTDYAGEKYVISHKGYDPNDQPLTPSTPGLVDVKVRVVAPDGTDAVAERSMDWDPTNVRWVYVWKSPPAGGTYKARCIVYDGDGEAALEVKKFRLKPPP